MGFSIVFGIKVSRTVPGRPPINMTNILSDDPKQRARWRQQANASARQLKLRLPPETPILKIGFAFDDAIITIELERKCVIECDTDELAEILYDGIVEAVEATREGTPPPGQRH